MKKIIALVGLLALTVLAFSMNIEEPSVAQVKEKVEAAQQAIAQSDSFRGKEADFLEIMDAYERLYQENVKDAIFLNETLQKAVFTTRNGQSATIGASIIKDRLESEDYGSSYKVVTSVEDFYTHLNQCNQEKAKFDNYVARVSEQNAPYEANRLLMTYIDQNMAIPFSNLTREDIARPLASCYATYRVGDRSLVEYMKVGRGIVHPDIAEDIQYLTEAIEILTK